ncbi:T9SS type A sorting domain-containing protein [Rufibacter glacialis]|nr:T9SS type A sorting domain-containing protein [Rufibacter glacialis]GGK88067.1 hypothetical protein GCM10011405_39830 [Rufibacter glacialis]
MCVVSLLQVEANGQRTILYHENFSGSASNITHNWQVGNTPLATRSYAKASRAEHVHTAAAPGTYTLTLEDFSTGGYEEIQVSWGGLRVGDPSVKLEYSYNGGAFMPMEGWKEVSSPWWSKTTADLFTSFNKGKVSLRWTYTATSASTTYALDDITVTGVPYQGNPINPTSTFKWSSRTGGESPYNYAGKDPNRNKNNTFYETDGVKMLWGKEDIGNAGMYVEQVTPDYQYKDAFTIGQQYWGTPGAENYTKSTLYLSVPVEGLSFLVNDIDETPGNSRDIVKIVAYKADGTRLFPQKHLAQTTSFNEYASVGEEYVFRSKTDVTDTDPLDYNEYEVPNTSQEGDISVTFLEAVDRVDIFIYNGVPNGIYKGQQGLAIADISWRNISHPAPKADFTTQSGLDPNPLPVTLTAFTVRKMAEGAQLEWATASEINNDRFVVERSVDGKTFEAIGEVRGSGNSSALVNYSFLDRAPHKGHNYYRLTQHDYDGTSESSKIIYLSVKSAVASVAMTTYPNPATHEVTIKAGTISKEDQTFHILNAAGGIVKTVVLPKNEASVVLPLGEFATGLYLVKSGTSVARFLKQ